MPIVDHVMRTYSLLVTLTPEQEAVAREQVTKFLADKKGDDRSLAVEAIKFLRGNRPHRGRMQRA